MNYKNKSGTYTITNHTNGKVYYGSAACIEKRWGEHRRSLRRGDHHNAHLQRAWNKYGPASFTFAVFDCCEPEDLHAYEQILLDQHAGKDYCYNIALNATSPFLGKTHSEASRAKISEAMKGEENPFYGKTLSEEHKRKISEAHLGKTLSEESRAKISEAMKGRVFSEEHRRKLSEAQEGKKHPKVICPHCNKTGGTNVMHRWHFHNCKHRQEL